MSNTMIHEITTVGDWLEWLENNFTGIVIKHDKVENWQIEAWIVEVDTDDSEPVSYTRHWYGHGYTFIDAVQEIVAKRVGLANGGRAR